MAESTLLPADKLAALRVRQVLLAEVPASVRGRRAYVEIWPQSVPADAAADAEGWKHSDPRRSFDLTHHEYGPDLVGEFDDEGIIVIREATAPTEDDLFAMLRQWDVDLATVEYPWRTDLLW